jgi:hypothetical protein
MVDLTNLDDVKAWLNLDNTKTADDAILSSLITAASGFIETWCTRSFGVASHTDVRDGTAGVRMPFWHYPVSAVECVTIDGQGVPPGDAVRAPGYYFTPTMLMLRGYQFRRGFGNVVVSYTAGFAVIPPDLARACLDLVAFQYREAGRIGMASSALSGETTSFVIRDMPPRVATLLGQYKRVTPL